jgi:hypothetical protein
MKSESKTMVTVSRLWNNPKIETTISITGISITMNMDDFKIALIDELVGAGITGEHGIAESIDKVIEGIKAESAKVV